MSIVDGYASDKEGESIGIERTASREVVKAVSDYFLN